ncbi:MAG: excalibur calcium-binding domain-containing protein [Segniliparus sp.]|uniref:excalibur calcium-binding domain-containing protein n=1 Tax=Segniliparus sp. TaxID=2804064 RepID=UPI003F2DD7E5
MTRTAWGACLLGLTGMLLAPAAPLAVADDSQSSSGTEAASGQAQGATPPAPVWVKGPYGQLYPVGGWKSCAEAQAHSDTPIKAGDLGYNPALDPTHSGIECI